MGPLRVHLLIAILILGSLSRSEAAWRSDGVPLCEAPRVQFYPAAAADGSGGAFVTWFDDRSNSSSWDIYLQHIDAEGALHAGWLPNGVRVCTALGAQVDPAVVSDGGGGAIVAWTDSRDGISTNIYAQRILASGAIAPDWPVDGLLLSSRPTLENRVRLLADGEGGAFVIWHEVQNSFGIYIQRVTAQGQIASGWPANGLATGAIAVGEIDHAIISDEAGGAFIVWTDAGSRTSGADIYAQRITAGGTNAPGWPASGLPVCIAPGVQETPTVVSDGAQGLIAAWKDGRSLTGTDLYAVRVRGTGEIADGWPTDGLPICLGPASQPHYPFAVSDGMGGAIVGWEDWESEDVHAQRVTSSGTIPPGWPINGRSLSAAPRFQGDLTGVSDGSGGALFIWTDGRPGNGDPADIYAQHVLGNGSIAGGWPPDGIPISQDPPHYQTLPAAVQDGAGGAIVAWSHRRDDPENMDIFASRVSPGGVVYSRTGDLPPALVLENVLPNPAVGPLIVAFRLPDNRPATLELFDMAGRRQQRVDVGDRGLGRHVVTLAKSGRLPAGIYIVRLSREGVSVAGKACVLQ